MKDVLNFAWLAGYIDGDGCISISRRTNSGNRMPEIYIGSTDKEILDWCVFTFGGSLQKRKLRQGRNREQWQWRTNGALKTIAILKGILPFLRCADKRARAQLLVDEWERCTPRNGWYTADLREKRIALEARFLSIGQGRKGAKHYPSSPL